MRILHLGPSMTPVRSDRGGALQRRIFEMSRLQAAHGHDVTVLSPATGYARSNDDGVSMVDVPLRFDRPWRDLEYIARSRRLLRDDPQFDILHAHGAPHAARVLNTLAKRSVHSVDFYEYTGSNKVGSRSYYRWALDGFSANLPVSDYCLAGFSAYYPTLVHPIRKLGNGVNLDQFRPDKSQVDLARHELALPDGRIVLYLGRVCEQKGSDMLEDLAKALATRIPDARVVAAGPPEQFGRSGVTPLIERLVGAGVTCPGAVPERLLAGLLNAAAVFVLPTRRYEMFGMAAVEAQACEVPVVASRLGGIPEAVGPGGVLIEPGDAQALANAVVEVLESPDRARSLAEQGRLHARSWGWHQIVDDADTIYREVLAQNS